jgi:hypothetical protein
MQTTALVGGLLCLLFGVPVAACSCVSIDPPAAFNAAKAVFIAEVIDSTEQVSIPNGQDASKLVEAGEVRVTVAEVFKGELGRDATVLSSSDRNNSCGILDLRRGKQYVFYAYGSQGDSKLYVGRCSRTGSLDSGESREDLRFLRDLPPAGSGGTLRGGVIENRRWQGAGPLPGITLQIRGPQSQQLTAITGSAGKFEVKGLPPGRYRVRPQYSSTHVGETGFMDVELSDRGAADVGFVAFINGELRVRIVDRRGRPFNNTSPQLQEAHLINDSYPFPNDGSPVGTGGNFLVRGVPPGDYLLYLNVEDTQEHRRQKYFYPGTFNSGEAVTFKIGLLEKKRAVPNFRLPEGFIVRSVTGRVTLQDGRPATRASVTLNCGTASAPMLQDSAFNVRVDAKGRFRVDAIVGQKYLLSAHGYGAAEALVQSPKTPIEVAPGQVALERDLVLSESGLSSGCRP